MKGTTILGGEFKREKLGQVPPELAARPILARIKKSLFDILKTRVPGATFLDLFAGSGSVGLEAISRGAAKVVFVDLSPISVRWIQKTLARLSERHPEAPALRISSVRRVDVLSGLGSLNEGFELIFSGAPYVDAEKKPLYFVEPLLRALQRDKVIRTQGWFIAQHHKKEKFTDTPEGWNFFRQEQYGDSVLSFFENITGKEG